MSAESAKQRLLVVEDEQHLAAGLKLNLELEGYEVEVANNAKQAGQALLKPDSYDAIILDVMLPDVDGFELCGKLRDTGNFVPVIMLTARSSADDRVRGLEAGADDYLVKPFDLQELLARVRSLIRRQRWQRGSSSSRSRVFEFGFSRVDFDSHEVTVRGEPIKLTQLEIDLVLYFAEHAGRVIGREELLEKVWKLRNYTVTRTVDNFVSRLRRYFEEDPSDPKLFVSVRGAGYRFVPNGSKAPSGP